MSKCECYIKLISVGGYEGYRHVVKLCPYHANAPTLVAELAEALDSARCILEADNALLNSANPTLEAEIESLLTRAATYKEKM